MINKKVKIISTCMLIGVALSICSCGAKSSRTQNTKKKQTYNYFSDIEIKENQECVYSNFHNKLGIYDVKTKTWTPVYDEDNVCEYSYSGIGEYYTIGNSRYNKFSVIKVEDERIVNVINIDEKDSLMPIGIYKDELYFIYNVDDLSSNINRKLVKLNKDTNEIEDIFNTENQLLSEAVFVENKIYYNEYIEESDSYKVYAYDIVTNENTLVKENIQGSGLYQYNNELLYNDGMGSIRSFDSDLVINTIKGDAETPEINAEYGLMFESFVDKNNDISCKVTNIETGEKVASVQKYVGYKIEDNKLYLYCTGKIHTIDL